MFTLYSGERSAKFSDYLSVIPPFALIVSGIGLLMWANIEPDSAVKLAVNENAKWEAVIEAKDVYDGCLANLNDALEDHDESLEMIDLFLRGM